MAAYPITHHYKKAHFSDTVLYIEALGFGFWKLKAQL